MPQSKTQTLFNQTQSAWPRYLIAIALFVLCAVAAVTSVRAGLSRLKSGYDSTIDSATAALRLNSSDPEAHYAFAVQLSAAGEHSLAAEEFARAAALRQHDYFLWQELGCELENAGDSDEAITSLRRAVQLAPAYSQPHWHLGNVFLRSAKTTEAFHEMRQAATSDPTLFPAMCDLAWGIYDGNVPAIFEAVKPATDDERVALARLFLKQGQLSAAFDLLYACRTIAKDDRRAFVQHLIDVHEYENAYKLWSDEHGNDRGEPFDGGFESLSDFDAGGFGWRFTPAQTVRPTVDLNDPHSGTRSLRLDCSGNFSPSVPIFSQLVIVSAGSRYQLSFAVRTEGLASAAFPLVTVRDAADERRVIGESAPLSAGTNNWRAYSIGFATSKETKAITINVQRQSCVINPCPIVGRVWFDSFSLTPE